MNEGAISYGHVVESDEADPSWLGMEVFVLAGTWVEIKGTRSGPKLICVVVERGELELRKTITDCCLPKTVDWNSLKATVNAFLARHSGDTAEIPVSLELAQNGDGQLIRRISRRYR